MNQKQLFNAIIDLIDEHLEEEHCDHKIEDLIKEALE